MRLPALAPAQVALSFISGLAHFSFYSMKRFLPLVSLTLALAAQPGRAQVATTLSVTGDVQSDDQQALPGAAVTLIHSPTGTRYAAATNAAGHFVVPNLPAGGPYLMQVGEGGYRSQTVESIFLEKGKTATFTVTLSRLNPNGKSRANRPALAKATGADVLAPESTVGGPVLFATTAPAASTIAPLPATGTPTPASGRRAQPLPQIMVDPATAPEPTPKAAGPPRAARSARYPVRRTLPAADPIVPGHYDAKSGNYIYETGAATTLQLAGGGAVAGVGVHSTESNLYRFLTNPAVQVDTLDLTRGWFNFDRVFFETGKASLTAESMGQLRNVASILRAYPRARIKLGGYTDSTGTYKVNKQLSEARARTAWASLVEMGISPARIDARGYGPRYAIAPNTSEEGRAKNRRLSLKVLQK